MAELSLHPFVQRDLRQILEHYRMEGGDRLANKFFAEADQMVERIRLHPERFHFIDEHYRRANFQTFPHHFIFDNKLSGPRITVLRHHKRSPRYGMGRK